MRWVLIALLGLAVAAVVSLSASDLTSQPVGLSSEPLTAGDQLAPRSTVTRTVTVRAKRPKHAHRARTTTVPVPVPTTTVVRPPATTARPVAPAPTTTSAHERREHERGGESDGDD